MFILTSIPESGAHLFTSETFAVEALVIAGKEFMDTLSKDILPSLSNSPEEKASYEADIKETIKKLEEIQTLRKFNSIITDFKYSSLGVVIKNQIDRYRGKWRFVSVFFLPYRDEESYLYSSNIALAQWELKEVTENSLLADSLRELKDEFF